MRRECAACRTFNLDSITRTHGSDTTSGCTTERCSASRSGWPESKLPRASLRTKENPCSVEFSAGADIERSLGMDTSKGLDVATVGLAVRHFALACLGCLVE